MPLLYFILSLLLKYTVGLYGFLRDPSWSKLTRLAECNDRTTNALCREWFNRALGKGFGDGRETISSRIGRNKLAGTLTPTGKFIDKILDRLDPDHSIKNIGYVFLLVLFASCVKDRPMPEIGDDGLSQTGRPVPRPKKPRTDTIIHIDTIPTEPNITKLIYVNFNGETVVHPDWNYGNPIVCAPAQLTQDQRSQVMGRLRQKLVLFQVNATDDISLYNSTAPADRQKIIVTPTSYWRTGVSGISYTGTYGTETPAFVFSDRLYNTPGYIGEICAHELGHTLGLNHQMEWNHPDCSLISSYRMGTIMGNSLYSPDATYTSWGETFCNIYVNEINKIAETLPLR